jgi:hypothetical protein
LGYFRLPTRFRQRLADAPLSLDDLADVSASFRGVSPAVEAFASAFLFSILRNSRIFSGVVAQESRQSDAFEAPSSVNAISKRFQRPIFFGDDIFTSDNSLPRSIPPPTRPGLPSLMKPVGIAADARGPVRAQEKFFRKFFRPTFRR